MARLIENLPGAHMRKVSQAHIGRPLGRFWKRRSPTLIGALVLVVVAAGLLLAQFGDQSDAPDTRSANGPSDAIASATVTSTVDTLATATTGALPGSPTFNALPLDPRLRGSVWLLASIDGERIASDTNVTIEPNDDSVRGRLTCNWYTLYATLRSDGSVTESRGSAGERWVMTAAGCTTSSLTADQYSEFADRYEELVLAATRFALRSGKLHLYTGDNHELVFVETP